jgi:cytoskeletal protein RodZ
METTNTPKPEIVAGKTNRGWSLISMLAAFAIGWAVAFAMIQVWHGRSREKADNAVKPVVAAVQNAVESVKKATTVEAGKPTVADKNVAPVEAPVPATSYTATATVEAVKPVVAPAATDTVTDEREVIRKSFQRNIETSKILTSR